MAADILENIITSATAGPSIAAGGDEAGLGSKVSSVPAFPDISGWLGAGTPTGPSGGIGLGSEPASSRSEGPHLQQQQQLDPSVGSELVALAVKQANREGALSTAKAKVEELEREVADLEKEVSTGVTRMWQGHQTLVREILELWYIEFPFPEAMFHTCFAGLWPDGLNIIRGLLAV